MSVHNSKHGDDSIEDPDIVTLISKLDISDPLHLHPNDFTALTIVSLKLKGTKNYQVWSCAMLLALKDNSYKKIRSFVLSREVLPDRNRASAFISNVPNRNNFQRNNQNVNSGPPRPNNLNSNKQGRGSALVCKDCGFNGHTIKRCFKIIGYPADFGKRKPGQNFKGKNVYNNNSFRTSSSSGFTDE
ncbi:ribonuclease H-like domain-containing protein [Tanacetum coccineum]